MAIDELMKELQHEFLEEVTFLLDDCERSFLNLEKQDNRIEELEKIFRFVHSLKGTGSSVGFNDLSVVAHTVEDCLSILKNNPELINTRVISTLLKCGDAFKSRILELKQGASDHWEPSALKEEVIELIKVLIVQEKELKSHSKLPTETNIFSEIDKSKDHKAVVKVDQSRLESVLDLIGELVVIKGQLLQEMESSPAHFQKETFNLLDRTVRELQDKTLFMRLTSLKSVFLKVQRAVRDVAIHLDKKIEFVMEGEDVEIDRTICDLLGDPLIHIARNAVDHGIENSIERINKGKKESACIRLTAKQTAGRVIIEIKDDGRGIDPQKIIKKAVEKGLLANLQSAENLSHREVFQFLFQPGFSTAENITDISGRGVGLDVVKSSVEKLKGVVEVQSDIGIGTIFRISLPITTAITDGIIIKIKGLRFVVPINSISEIVRVNSDDIFALDDKNNCVIVRNNTLPLVSIEDLIQIVKNKDPNFKEEQTLIDSKQQHEKSVILVSEFLGKKIGLYVDTVLGQSQVVVKSLSEIFNNVVGLAGASILGDGGIALVLDLESLCKQMNHTSQQTSFPNQDSLEKFNKFNQRASSM